VGHADAAMMSVVVVVVVGADAIGCAISPLQHYVIWAVRGCALCFLHSVHIQHIASHGDAMLPPQRFVVAFDNVPTSDR